MKNGVKREELEEERRDQEDRVKFTLGTPPFPGQEAIGQAFVRNRGDLLLDSMDMRYMYCSIVNEASTIVWLGV